MNPIRILIVEDDADIGDLLQATLTVADNVGKCPACGDTVNPGGNPYFSVGGNEMPDGSDCPDCSGTGIVIKDGTYAN